ncbi:XRE family transcriptional regulator [Streptomyces albofaciens JCM 4342]|uniref:helix-turn-helix domain-containing protein n=1 Tax=Streptomyces albofaciens TaxID=66866 RepID=UPI001238789A|nr:XRE family transcriptional regulator [Streptomyces albofaciens]KAA6214441.1 XRE family transcriptional regulator [Streptomyces albofaciens JCM 4342]
MSGTRASGPVEGARLAAALRELRGRTGLSLAALATKTAYSKSSWERYLNGKSLPPREAVEALCRLAGERGGRVAALWELADAAWSGRGRSAERASEADVRESAPPPPEGGGDGARRPEDVPGSAPSSGVRRVTPVVGVAAVLAVTVVLAAVLVVVGEWRAGTGGAGRQANTAVSAAPSARTGCHGAACDGQNPLVMLCGGEGLVTTVLRHRATGGRHLQIRYSKACGAAWGRLRGGRIGDRLRIDAPGGRSQSTRVTDRFDADGYVFTPMAAASGPEKLRVCLRPAGGGPAECFRTS